MGAALRTRLFGLFAVELNIGCVLFIGTSRRMRLPFASRVFAIFCAKAATEPRIITNGSVALIIGFMTFVATRAPFYLQSAAAFTHGIDFARGDNAALAAVAASPKRKGRTRGPDRSRRKQIMMKMNALKATKLWNITDMAFLLAIKLSRASPVPVRILLGRKIERALTLQASH
ncbi:MAG: hypothetical protein QOJ42_2826 [Acidobacteriaceae bacterium]|nr:hypothetical protein [Acidobacteriaceae bacterium]